MGVLVGVLVSSADDGVDVCVNVLVCDTVEHIVTGKQIGRASCRERV